MNLYHYRFVAAVTVFVFAPSVDAVTSINRFDFSKHEWRYRPTLSSSFSIGATVDSVHTDKGVYDPPISTYSNRHTSLSSITRSSNGLRLEVKQSSYLPGRATEEFLIQYRLVYGPYYTYETQVAFLYDKPLIFDVQPEDGRIATLSGYATIQYPGPVLMFGSHPGTQKNTPVPIPNGWSIPFSYSLVNLTGEWTEDSINRDVNYRVEGYFDFSGAIPPLPKDPDQTLLLLEGDPIPGADTNMLPADAVWRGFGTPSINDEGDIAFLGEWDSPSGRGQGVFVGSPNTPNIIATIGQQVPGRSEGVTFQSIMDPLLNDAGEVVFMVQLRGPGIDRRNRKAIIKSVPDKRGELVMIVQQGYSTDSKETLQRIDDVAFSNFSEGGSTVVFTGMTSYYTEYRFYFRSFFVRCRGIAPWATTTTQSEPYPIIKPGDSVVFDSGAETLRRVHLLDYGAGQGRGVVKPEDDASNIMMMVTTTERTRAVGSVTEFGDQAFPYRVGAQAPGFDEGVLIQSLGMPTQDETALLAFHATVATKRSPWDSLEVIYAEDDTYTALPTAVTGDAAPGIEGATFVSFSAPVSSHKSRVSFIATLDGATSSIRSGVWSGSPEGLVLTAAESLLAPDTDGAAFLSFGPIAQPASAAGPIFMANLRQEWPTITFLNDSGLWGTMSNGDVRLLLREGDSLASGTVRRIEVLNEVNGSPAQTRAFNATGVVIAKVELADGREGVVQLRYY